MSHAESLMTEGRPTDAARSARVLRSATLGILLSALPLTGTMAQLNNNLSVSTETKVDATVSSPSPSTSVDSATSATVGTADSVTGTTSVTTSTTGSVTGTVSGTTGTVTGTVGGTTGTVTGTVGGTAGTVTGTVGGTTGGVTATIGTTAGASSTALGAGATTNLSAEAKTSARALYLQALGISEGDIGLQLTPGEGAIELDDEATFQLIASGWGQVRFNADDGFADHAERIKAFVQIATSLGYEASVGVLQAHFGTIAELSAELSAEARARVEAIRAALRGELSAEARAELQAELSALLTAGRQAPQGASAWWTVDLDVTGDGRVTVADLHQVAANQ